MWRTSSSYRLWLQQVEARYHPDDPTRMDGDGNKGNQASKDMIAQKERDIAQNDPTLKTTPKTTKDKALEKLGNDTQTKNQVHKLGSQQIDHNAASLPMNPQPAPTDYSLASQMKLIGDSSLMAHPLNLVSCIKPNTQPLPKPTNPVSVNIIRYIVKPGDWLSKIALQFYGDHKKWIQIYNDNKSIIGSNPNMILPGQVLLIHFKGKINVKTLLNLGKGVSNIKSPVNIQKQLHQLTSGMRDPKSTGSNIMNIDRVSFRV